MLNERVNFKECFFYCILQYFAIDLLFLLFVFRPVTVEGYKKLYISIGADLKLAACKNYGS